MKSALLLFVPSLLSAQLFSFGVKGGLIATPASEAAIVENRFFFGTTDLLLNRYTFGPTVEVRIPWGFRVEVDGLFKREREHAYGGPFPTGSLTYQTSSVNIWEAPMLLKRRFGGRWFSPYAAVGGTIRHVGEQHLNLLSVFPGYPSSTQQATFTPYPSVMSGITAAGGVSFKTRFVRVEPEVRYTHWTSKHFLASTEEVEMLVGLVFR
jgi:hypothetical protein